MHDKQIRRRRAVLAVLVVISLILLTDYFGESSNSPLHSVQRGVVEVLSPIQDGASKVLSPVRDVAGYVSSTVRAKSQVANYRAEVDKLTGEVAVLQAKQGLYEQEAALVHLDTNFNLDAYGLEAAHVTGRDSLPFYDTITIDKGSDAGVKPYDPVVGPGGLVGDVSADVGPSYALVTLLTSPKFSVAAMIESDAEVAGLIQPAAGDTSTLQLINLPSTAQLSTNDMVVTSGFQDQADKSIQSFAPVGIPIGTVSTEDPEDSVQTSGQVQVTPFVDLAHLSVVQILTKPHRGS